MKRHKLKEWVIPALSIFIVVGGIFSYYLISNLINYQVTNGNFLVTDSLIETTQTVNNEKIVPIQPYTSEKVTVEKYYYSKDDDNDRQKNSLINYNNIYMPNTGILYSSDEQFEIVSILDGKVIQIKEDEILGKIVQIEHEDNTVTIYQSLSEIKVKEGEIVKQGQVIALSGSNGIKDTKENCLHFEVYKNNLLVNPETLYN